MNALEKYAAKKRTTKKLIEALVAKLYGKKPGEVEGKLEGLGALGGSIGGFGLGGMTEASKQGWEGWKALAMGAGLGGSAGAIGGAKAGRAIDKARMAKYLANKKKINKKLAIGAGVGTGTGGLAALLVGKKEKTAGIPGWAKNFVTQANSRSPLVISKLPKDEALAARVEMLVRGRMPEARVAHQHTPWFGGMPTRMGPPQYPHRSPHTMEALKERAGRIAVLRGYDTKGDSLATSFLRAKLEKVGK